MLKKKILVIDDTEFMTKLISDTLTEAGYVVVTASDGYQGLEKVGTEKPDLVILDIVMPGIDGFEVCRILREDDRNNLMPIIMLTAQEDEDDKLTGLELGADDYIIKPFNHRELLSRVRNTLKRIDRNRWANPLTGLRGNVEIQMEIDKRIAGNKLFAVLYADIDNFKSYNDAYGYASGDRAIKVTADIIVENVKAHGNPDDFTGHIGGDDFIVISTPDKIETIAKEIISDFDKRAVELYSKEDAQRGYVVTSDRQGQPVKVPLITISLAIVTNEAIELTSHGQISEIATVLKNKAKAILKSTYTIYAK
jgi:diguanylate cyclase (GGDEF)-like protein